MKKNIMRAELDAAIRASMGNSIKEVCLDVMSDEKVWEEIDKIVQEWLDKTEARLSFFDGEPTICLSVGGEERRDDQPTQWFPVQFCDIKTYVNAEDIHKEIMKEQVVGIDRMITQLTLFRSRLTTKIDQPEN